MKISRATFTLLHAFFLAYFGLSQLLLIQLSNCSHLVRRGGEKREAPCYQWCRGVRRYFRIEVCSTMLQYDDLIWRVSFPLVCFTMLWFSLALAVMVRAGSWPRRASKARRRIEQLIMAAPLVSASTPTSSLMLPTHGGKSSLISPVGATAAGPRTAVEADDDEDLVNGGCNSGERVRVLVVPTGLRVATRAIVRRAVVFVGGDFARSPRMQYHAASLARSGLFDEVQLIGLDCGNHLSEDLLNSGEPAAEAFVTRERGRTGNERAVYDVEERLRSPSVRKCHGCLISTRYLIHPPKTPEWFQAIFPVRAVYWVAGTLYKTTALMLLFAWQTLRATAMRVNVHGQLLITDVVMMQSPPAVPFIFIIKYAVLPLCFVYNVLLYYGVVVPVSWMKRCAVDHLRKRCQIQRGDVAVDRSVFYPIFVVDWHNYGYTILEQSHRPAAVVAVYKFAELHLSAGAVNITVSQAMKQSLLRHYPSLRLPTQINTKGDMRKRKGIQYEPIVLYDTAPSFFAPQPHRHSIKEIVSALSSLPLPPSLGSSTTSCEVPDALKELGWGISGPPSWIREEIAEMSSHKTPVHSSVNSPLTTNPSKKTFSASPFSQKRRNGLMIVGSTSWTEDDDYTVLINALQRLDHRLEHYAKYAVSPHRGTVTSSNGGSGGGELGGQLASTVAATASTASGAPLDVWVLITGKGETRSRFEDAVRAARLSRHVVVSTYYAQSYLEYSKLLAAADVGLCMHFSSSGLDLPMKAVDMMGVGLPVVALNFPAISEMMGSGARVLAQAPHGQPTLIECERGWLFTGAADLEALLISFVGLPINVARDGSLHSNGLNAATSLDVMSARAVQARQSALAWEKTWDAVVLPLLCDVV